MRRFIFLNAEFWQHCAIKEVNAVTHNPVRGVKRPWSETAGGKTPKIADGQARVLLDAPSPNMLKGKRGRAILAVLFFHALRRQESCKLRVKDIEQPHGVTHLSHSDIGGTR